MPRLSRPGLDQLRRDLDKIRQDSHFEPIVIIMWVVAGSNEPPYDNCTHWQATDMDGITLNFAKSAEESMARFQDRVGSELESACRKAAEETGFFRYILEPIRD